MRFSKRFVGYVCINLGGGDAGMSEHHLYRTKVCSITKEISCEHVPHDVRSYFFGNAGFDSVLFYYAFDGSFSDT